MYTKVQGVKVFSWNPRMFYYTPVVLRGNGWTFGRRINNFGDTLGPAIAERLLHYFGIRDQGTGILHSVGSVLHLAHKSATLWGTGIRRVDSFPASGVKTLDIRAVRGPLTRAAIETNGGKCPEVFGDPGLLVPVLFPEFAQFPSPREHSETTVIPNLNDSEDYTALGKVVNPCSPLSEVIAEIRSSSFVTGTSLHAAVLADAYGIPNRVAIPKSETALKYDDYYEGTGRINQALKSVEDCISAGPASPFSGSLDHLIDSFPRDLWESGDAT